MTTAHPSYPNPTIVEALCEVHFQLPPGREWKSSLPGELFKRIQDEYPEMEPGVEVAVQVDVAGGQKVLPARYRTRFRHRERPVLLQFGENILTLNFFRPYPGWVAMSQQVLSAWDHVRRIIEPAAIVRVGVRYVNRIERVVADERPSAWLLPGDYIPAGVLRSGLGSFLRVEAHLDGENRLIITLGNTLPEQNAPEAGHGAIIFDIDRFTEHRLPPSPEVFTRELSGLHEHVWQTFCAAKTERLEQLLQGRPGRLVPGA